MKRILILCCLFFQAAHAQTDSVTLEQCVRWTKLNFPQAKQSGLVSEITRENLNAVEENWLPKLGFLAKGTYNTEVVQFDFPGISTKFPHDSYVANVNLDQALYDGGQTRAQKNIERINEQVELQRNEVELYKLVDRVSQLYVSILLTKENLEVLDIFKANLESRRKDIEASVKNGLALESSLDEIDAEILKSEQNIAEARESLISSLRSLSMYTGQNFSESTNFSQQALGGNSSGDNITRPEMKLFELQSELLASRNTLTNRYAMPRVSLFADANYGRPGPNFINQQLRFFGDAGLMIRWNISSLYGLNREKSKFDINQRMIDVQRETFLFNIRNTLETQAGQIAVTKDLIDRDRTIIEKRHNVTQTASAQLENGKITFTDYLLQLNAEMQAVLNQKMHEIRLMGAMSNYNSTKGINNF
jgi:outer membrane protein TolC